ncbi:class C sortase [Enterococcus sp. 5H]|uniref:class C sortase n=1 Tax=Enterococcus sp. 5H TaxID=1229490 RepID=UPI0023045F3A|nr:class C sortase [Enterococcus sp. 5H]
MKKKTGQGRLFLSRIFYLLGLSILMWLPFRSVSQQLHQESELQQLSTQLTEGQINVSDIEATLASQNETTEGIDPFNTPAGSFEGYPDAVGMIDIPKIGERLPLYIGASDFNLSRGVAQISGTSLPFGGKNTQTVIAGHRGWYGPTLFLNIDQLFPGDLIYLSYLGQEGVYSVTGSEVIEPWQTDKLLETDKNEEIVTLLTCHPLFSSKERLLVHSRLLPESELKTLLQGQESFQDRKKLPVELTKTEQQQITTEQPTTEITQVPENRITEILVKVRPYQYFFYWIILGVGSMSGLYTLIQLLWSLVKRS